jgi:hypothetical protein
LQYKHYHCDKDLLEQEIINSELKDIVFHVHQPTEDILDHPFVKVINVGFDEETQGVIFSIPWISIAQTLYKEIIVPDMTVDMTAEDLPVPPKRQQYFKDVGYTTGRCAILKDELGVSFPVKKPSDDDHHVAMAGLSTVL